MELLCDTHKCVSVRSASSFETATIVRKRTLWYAFLFWDNSESNKAQARATPSPFES